MFGLSIYCWWTFRLFLPLGCCTHMFVTALFTCTWIPVFKFWGYRSRSEISGSYDNLMFNFWGITNRFSIFYSQQQRQRFQFLHFLFNTLVTFLPFLSLPSWQRDTSSQDRKVLAEGSLKTDCSTLAKAGWKWRLTQPSLELSLTGHLIWLLIASTPQVSQQHKSQEGNLQPWAQGPVYVRLSSSLRHRGWHQLAPGPLRDTP